MTISFIHCMSQYCRLILYVFVATQLLVGAYTNFYNLEKSSAKCYYQEFVNLRSIKLDREMTIYAAKDRTVATSSRQSSASGSQFRRKEVQPLITSLDRGRIRIGGQRWILPGDYIVHEEYGVGRCLQASGSSINLDTTSAFENLTLTICRCLLNSEKTPLKCHSKLFL